VIVNATLTGDRELVTHFDAMPGAVRQALQVKVTSLALRLEALVKTGKLDGQVLKRRTGALARSIHNVVTVSESSVIGKVYSAGDVKYARIHEYGGTTPPHIIEPKKAAVLAFMGPGGMVFAKRVNHPGSKMPERSFLRSALHDMSVTISTEMKSAVVNAVREQVK